MTSSPPKSPDEPDSGEPTKSAAEWQQLLSTLTESKASRFELKRVLFPKQLPFGLESRRFVTAVCTRRAGKTTAVAAKLLDVARKKAGCVALYIARSRVNAKRIFWAILKGLHEAYSLGGVISEGDLCINLANGSRIYLSGCVHEAEVDNFIGLPIAIVVLDEAQVFPSFIERLVDSALVPALQDFQGQLMLVGTPGAVPVGYFYDCCQSPEWAHHEWSAFDNPHILRKSGKTSEQMLEEELKRRGVTREDPTIQREWFGKWAIDTNALVFQFDATKNARPAPPCAHHVLCVDLGFDDADAIGVLGWNDDAPELYLVKEFVMPKQTLTPLFKQIVALNETYQPLAVVVDMGGLGKKIAMDLQERFPGLPIEAAEKNEKLAHIELLNDAMRTAQFYAPADSRFAQDCMKVEWDRSNPEKPKISDRFHSDICDAVLYGWRKCLQWLYVPPVTPGPLPGTVEHAAAEVERVRQQLEDEMQEKFERNLQAQQERDEAATWS